MPANVVGQAQAGSIWRRCPLPDRAGFIHKVIEDASMADGLIKEMPGVDLAGLSRTIFDLYRAGREVRYERFQPTALALIKEMLPFDSAWWGNAAAEPMEIHRLYLFNCDRSILEAYTPYMEQDFFRAALMAKPGVSVNMADLVTRAQYVRTALYRNVGKRYKVEWSLGTLQVEPVSSLYEFLTLWRHDRKKPFSETERQIKELLMPHLSEAHRVARLRQVLEGGNALNDRWALVDDRGFLREATPGFIHSLRDHWPNWRGSRVPQPLLEHVRTATPFSANRATFRIAVKGAYRFVQVQDVSAVDSLSPREHEIAMRYARGQSHAVIATAVGLSPSTVRNHISRCYRKLAVNNKIELSLRLSQDGAIFDPAKPR
jgi:DNA-binding CsgD family transcriptional regulator